MKNTPPHVKLTLPDGSCLTAVALSRRSMASLDGQGLLKRCYCWITMNRQINSFPFSF